MYGFLPRGDRRFGAGIELVGVDRRADLGQSYAWPPPSTWQVGHQVDAFPWAVNAKAYICGWILDQVLTWLAAAHRRYSVSYWSQLGYWNFLLC